MTLYGKHADLAGHSMAEKIIIDTPDTLFPFMPPVWELVGWIDDKLSGMPVLLHRMQEDDDLGLARLDRKTLRAACTDGVSPRTAEKIEGNLHEAIEKQGVIELLSRITLERAIVKDTNEAKWLAFSRGLLEGINQHQPIQKLELPLTLSFLERRTEAERQLTLTFHQTRKMEIPTEEKLSKMRKAICEALRHHTLLNSLEAQSYSTAMIDASRPGQARTTKLSARILKSLFCLRVDFYHQLLATFMVDMLKIRPSLKLSPLLDDALINQGGMGQLMPLLKQGELITPTYRLYELWCEAYSPPGESLSYRAMAMHLPCPDPGRTRVGSDSDQQDIESVINETRLSRLKQWRGGTVPNTDQLTAFLESMTGETYGAFLPFIMTRVATAWTKWIEQERAMLKQLVKEHPALSEDMDLDWLVERFSRYPQYWEHSKARANQK